MTFGDQECVHHLELDVKASVTECYDFFADLDSIKNCVDVFRDWEEDPDDPDSVLVHMLYRYATLPSLELIFAATNVENVPGETLSWVSTAGMPCAGLVDLEPLKKGLTKVKVRVVYIMPVQLGLFNEVSAVRSNVDYELNKSLEKVRTLIESGL